MVKCIFCGKDIEKGTGKLFVRTTGQILNFCSHKCEKNLLKLNRKPRTTRWTEEYKRVKKSGEGLKKEKDKE